MMINFLDETLSKIGNRLTDIAFIGSENHEFCTSWFKFETLANFTYDNQSGDIVIPEDLIIEFHDGYKLVRKYDHDGECWKLINTKPNKNYKLIRKLHALGGRTLKEVDEAIDRENLDL